MSDPKDQKQDAPKEKTLAEKLDAIVEIDIPMAVYRNGEMFLGKCKVPQRLADEIMWQLSYREDHDRKLVSSDAPKTVDLGMLRGK